MKQILQSLKNGATKVASVPCPAIKQGHLLIRTTMSLISSGTERMLVEFGTSNFIEKARQQPDKVRMVLNKVKTDGLMPTIETVMNKLDQPLPMGYCNMGVVTAVGEGVSGFTVGDRVASNGNHAEMVCVPMHLCARVPGAVSDDEAVFTVVGAISLQGIRLAQPTLGENVVVTGLGLIGLMTVQLLKAHGCRVMGLDFDRHKLELAKQFGAEVVDLSVVKDPVAATHHFSRGRGVDAVIVTASTESSEPMHQAALMCRKRGRIVLVGVTGLALSRDDFFKKELIFQVSASYGPGRYDPAYEEQGQDYPIGFVRWTEQRNFEAVLDMLADGRVDVKPLISHRFVIDDAENAYSLVRGTAPSLGILLEYPNNEGASDELLKRTVKVDPQPGLPVTKKEGAVSVAFIGSGNYATAVLIPAFRSAQARLRCVASSAGVSGVHAARKYGFEETTTEPERLFSNTDINTIVVATRHNTHSRFVVQALEAGKNVFVEKPLAITLPDLALIDAAYSKQGEQGSSMPLLMVGFNRRFAPHTQKIRTLLAEIKGPKSFVMTVNAGAIPSDHWTQDPSIGGGRIIGEACHFIDLLRFLADSSIKAYRGNRMDGTTGDTLTIELTFQDGSIGTIHYFANGSKSFPKERLEIFAAGKVLQLDNYRKLTAFGWSNFRKLNLWRQNKGQKECAAAFINAVKHGLVAPIPYEEIMEVSRVSIEIAEACR